MNYREFYSKHGSVITRVLFVVFGLIPFGLSTYVLSYPFASQLILIGYLCILNGVLYFFIAYDGGSTFYESQIKLAIYAITLLVIIISQVSLGSLLVDKKVTLFLRYREPFSLELNAKEQEVDCCLQAKCRSDENRIASTCSEFMISWDRCEKIIKSDVGICFGLTSLNLMSLSFVIYLVYRIRKNRHSTVY